MGRGTARGARGGGAFRDPLQIAGILVGRISDHKLIEEWGANYPVAAKDWTGAFDAPSKIRNGWKADHSLLF